MSASIALERRALAHVRGLDHVVVRVADLDLAEATWARLGFALTPRGFHVGRGSANHTAPFAAGNYIELIHLPQGSEPFGRKAEGPVAVALRPTTSSELYAELTGRGYEVEPPRDLARPVDVGTTAREARFVNVSLPSVGLADLRLFACQHLTRHLVWRPDYEVHPNGAADITGLIAVADDPARTASDYGAVFGDRAVTVSATGAEVEIGTVTLSILNPAAFARAYPSEALPNADGLVGIVIGVRDVEAAAGLLKANGIDAGVGATGGLVVSAAATGGTLLEFRTARP